MKITNKSGFTLLEMSIVVLISGILMTSILNIIPVFYNMPKMYINTKKMEIIEDAFYAYIIKNNKLPQPANITDKLNKDTSSFGLESSNSKEVGTNNSLLIGMLPAVDLNMSPEYAYDSFGNKLVYIVNKNCTQNNGLLKCDDSSDNLITVNTSGSLTKNVVFAIISNGSNRKYSYNINEDEQRKSDTLSKYERCNSYDYFSDTSKCEENMVYNKTRSTKTFDDTVIFGSKEFIMKKLNMYDIGCFVDMDSEEVDNGISNCKDTPNFNNIDTNYMHYRDTIESEEYELDSNKYRCVIECGSYGKLNFYDYKTGEVVTD